MHWRNPGSDGTFWNRRAKRASGQHLGLVRLFFVWVHSLRCVCAAGASVSRVEDVSQVSTMIMMVVMVAFFVAYYSFINPNSSLAVICSMIPWLAPMVMFSRLALSNPPVVQVMISLVLLVMGSIFTTWVAARIYRIGILMYGKRPSVKEIWRACSSQSAVLVVIVTDRV